MKSLKKMFSALLITALLLSTAFSYTVSAASCSVSASNASGKKGDTVTVNVSISSVTMASCTVNLNYDSSKLEFILANKGGAASSFTSMSGANKVVNASQVRFTGVNTTNTTVSGTLMTVSFKILADSGSASLSTSGKIVTADYAEVSANYGSSTITIKSSGGGTTPTPPVTEPPAAEKPQTPSAAKSSDATLKSLEVKGIVESGRLTSVNLSPSFSSGTLSYKASIAGDVQRYQVNPVPNNSKASVNVPAGYLRMDAGSNVTKIYVTAEDGTKMTYIIYTEKAKSGESVTEPITDEVYTQALTEPSAEATTEADTITQIDIEEGTLSQESTESFDGESVQASNKQNRNKMYIKLGAAFGAVASAALITSIILFVKEGKKHKGDRQ